jgi:predicted permease
MVGAKGQIYEKGREPEAFVRVVSDGYFEAAGIPLRAGRVFTERDRASGELVAVVNETLARRLWPGQDAVGQMITQDGGRRVVGVVGDVRHRALEEMGGSEMYLPLRQTGDYSAVDLVVRTALPPDILASSVGAALRPIDPNLPAAEFQTLQELVDKAVSPRRFLVVLLGGFAGFALLLASLGIYGVISYSVSQRVQEIGIRMALGANRKKILKQVVGEGMKLAVTGAAIGMALAVPLPRVLEGLLQDFRVSGTWVYALIPAVICGVALLASYVPARRAARVDPMVALRYE